MGSKEVGGKLDEDVVESSEIYLFIFLPNRGGTADGPTSSAEAP